MEYKVMSRKMFWTLVILLTATAAAIVIFVCSKFFRSGEPDAVFVAKKTEKKKVVLAAQAAAKLNHAEKEELINSVIRQMKTGDQAALWFAIHKEDREFLLKKYGNDQQKVEKLFMDLLEQCAGNDFEKFKQAMLRDRIREMRMINNEGKWFIVPIALLGKRKIEF